MTKKFRCHVLNCTALLAMMPALAYAQTPDTADTASAAKSADTDIVVTGTRIVQDGYSAPTPVNVLGAVEINAQKPANITDLMYTLPAVSASSMTSANSAGNISAGNAGVSTINLRGLGAGRTLVLINGQRTPPSTFDNLVDINTIPQDLIERVEVVTGGASAQYGSDAVGGVINFILNEKFKGLKLGADTSITDYGDGHNYRFTATAGLSFLDDRLHILLNGEYFHQDPIGTVDRAWNNTGYQMITNPAYAPGNGQPERLVGSGIALAVRTKGGLINSGPLMGTYFLGDGVTGQLNYGIANSTSAPWMIGGDWRTANEGGVGTLSLMPRENRIGVFNRIAFDVTPDITVYGQFSWNRFHGRFNGGADYMDFTAQADNGFLLTQYPQVAADMQANGLGSVSVGSWWPIYGSDNTRQVFRYLGGAKGKFSLFDRPWSWDVYYQHGVTKTHEQTFNILRNDRFALAGDPVLSNGQVVCRSTLTDPTNGCVPLDLLGTGGPSAASAAYVFGPEQPWREQTFKQDAASVSLSGQLFDLPGGPVAIALGGEWRKDQAGGRAGATSSTGWRYGNYKVNRGEMSVKEAFLEVALPLFTGFNLDAAGRITDYSTSGTVKTWKVGATYSPVADVKFRGAYSHDVRAPNLQELFRAPSTSGALIILPDKPGVPVPGVYQVNLVGSGNPDLKPEIANTLTAGIVVTPSFVPGFSASFDYWDIKLKGAIGSVNPQSNVDFCYSGFSQFCDNIVFSGGIPVEILSQPVNFASQHTKGLDIEASYRTPLSAISAKLPGTLTIRATATHAIKSVVDNLVFPVDYAGVVEDGGFGSNAAMPNWGYRVSAFYEVDPVSINLVAHGTSSGVYSNEWIECTSSCPLSTVQHPTINNNHIDGALYFDGSVSVKLRSTGNETTLSFIVKNIFNKDPVLFGLDYTGGAVPFPQTARPIYDALGRVFRVALTSKF